MKTSTYNIYAPPCALPGCKTLVGYHKRYKKQGGEYGYKWKTFCEYHRTIGKGAVETFKLHAEGCENSIGIYGFICANPNIDPIYLEIDHFDGDRLNNSEDNLKRVCSNCHKRKTKENKEYQNRYVTRNTHFDNLFDIKKRNSV